MKRKQIVLGIALIGAILLPLAVYLSDDLNRAWWLPGEGSVSSGSVFGINVGEASDDAVRTLGRRGFRPVRIEHFLEDGRPRCLWFYHAAPGEELERWEAGRRVVCVAILDGNVTNVSWLFNPLEL